MADFTIKRNDTSPALKYQLQGGAGNPVDLSGYNAARFLMSRRGEDDLVVDADASGNVVVVNSSEGIVRYDWRESDTDEEGFYEAEWEVEYSDGTIETFPNDGFIGVYIGKDLG